MRRFTGLRLVAGECGGCLGFSEVGGFCGDRLVQGISAGPRYVLGISDELQVLLQSVASSPGNPWNSRGLGHLSRRLLLWMGIFTVV